MNMLLAKEVKILLLLATVYATRNQFNLNIGPVRPNECVNKIMEQYYIAPWTILLIDTDMQLPYSCIYQKTSQENFTKLIHRPADFYIITLENRSLENIFDLLQEFEIFDPRAHFLIILAEPYNPYIFQILAQYFIYKVVVLTLEDDLITYDPFIYEDVNATGIEPTDLGKCATFDVSVNIFNKTLPLLWRNTTVLATYVPHFPYIYRLAQRQPGGQFYDVFKVVAKKLEFETAINSIEETTNKPYNVMLNNNDFTLAVMFNYQMLLESVTSKLVKIKKDSTRVLTTFTLCAFLIISTLIKSKLIDSFRTHTTECPINTLEDIMKNNFKCYVRADIKELYRFDDSYSHYVSNCVELQEKNVFFNYFEIAKQVALVKDSVIVVETVDYKFLNYFLPHLRGFSYFNVPTLHRLKPKIKFEFLFAHFTKGYPLRDRFEKMVLRMFSTGIIQKLSKRRYKRGNRVLFTNEIITSKNITFQTISFSFYIWLTGIVVSTVVFFIEIVRAKIQTK
ncbi:hypothetical protein TcasGA2_TC002576 [Tribolium castaneum]|uniref:Ionotropic glutamate receptor C-terminal domain-containing protein n=1 Tax=Tribolium castaneum TaxID=7070 RepID=D6WFL4_TRICA|nr:hypothetical protein TcasGA2_TC002576 [Tribolium castaneum]